MVIAVLTGNVAFGKNTSAQTSWPKNDLIPSKAVDGNTGASYKKCYRSHAAPNRGFPWWIVDLGATHVIYNVTIYAVKNHST